MNQSPELLLVGIRYIIRWRTDTNDMDSCSALYTNIDVANGEVRVWFYDRGRHIVFYWKSIVGIEVDA